MDMKVYGNTSEDNTDTIKDLDFQKEFTTEELAIWEELIVDACWDFCFEVHRAVKLNYLYLDPLLDPFEDLQMNGMQNGHGKAEYEEFVNQKKYLKNKEESQTEICPKCLKEFTDLKKHFFSCTGSRTGNLRPRKNHDAENKSTKLENGPCKEKHKFVQRKTRSLKSKTETRSTTSVQRIKNNSNSSSPRKKEDETDESSLSNKDIYDIIRKS